MLKGKKLENGNPTVGIVALSAPEAAWNPDVYETGKKALIDRGIKVVESETVLTSYLYLAEKPKKIAESLQKMFTNDKVDVIMCAGGGNCMNKIIPYIDMDVIAKNYKPFIGISDITALLLALLNKNMVAFHGPFVLWNYGVDGTPTDYTHENLLSILSGYTGKLPAKTDWKVFREGVSMGKIIGGNISTISNIIGSPYCPVELFRDGILFIEDIAEGFPGLDSKLTHMKLLGVFDKIKGVVLGKLPECTPPEEAPEITLTDFLSLVFDGYSFPVIYDCDFGHIDDNLCLPFGCQVKIEADASEMPQITLVEKGVS